MGVTFSQKTLETILLAQKEFCSNFGLDFLGPRSPAITLQESYKIFLSDSSASYCAFIKCVSCATIHAHVRTHLIEAKQQ